MDSIINKIIDRADQMNLLNPENDRLSVLMDLESAEAKFHLKMEEFLQADDYNFSHDFLGIENNINRACGFPATDFGDFIPRFAG